MQGFLPMVERFSDGFLGGAEKAPMAEAYPEVLRRRIRRRGRAEGIWGILGAPISAPKDGPKGLLGLGAPLPKNCAKGKKKDWISQNAE